MSIILHTKEEVHSQNNKLSAEEQLKQQEFSLRRFKRADRSLDQQETPNSQPELRPSSANQGSQPGDNLKVNTGEYSASGLKRNLHGGVYQLKLLMLFLHKAIKEKLEFSLATEWDSAGKFDDVVFQYIEKNEGKKLYYRYLQAKHIQDESKKIGSSDLITEIDGKFSRPLSKFISLAQNCECQQ